jgi:hypothetical protein
VSALAVETTPAEDAFVALAEVGAASTAAPRTDPGPRVRLVAAPPAARPPAAVGPVLAPVPTLRRRVRALRATDRELLLEGADEPGALPDADPQPVACGIALAAVEVLAGRRPAAQLARWLTPGVYDALRMRAALTAQAIGADRARGRHATARRARVCAVTPGVVEAAVVADDGNRVRAVAVRLEAWRGQWRVTALEIG